MRTAGVLEAVERNIEMPLMQPLAAVPAKAGEGVASRKRPRRSSSSSQSSPPDVSSQSKLVLQFPDDMSTPIDMVMRFGNSSLPSVKIIIDVGAWTTGSFREEVQEWLARGAPAE